MTLAEVFLGEVVHQRPPAVEIDPDEVDYDFTPGVQVQTLVRVVLQVPRDLGGRYPEAAE